MDHMPAKSTLALLQRRRDDIRGWLDDEAPYTAFEQKHLDADTPERAYWHHGYQAALADMLDMLRSADRIYGSEDIPN
jgi:hypothetical protein